MDPALISSIVGCGVPALGLAGWAISFKMTRDPQGDQISKTEWVSIWEQKRAWLASAATGQQPENSADTLKEFISILSWTAARVKGYDIGLRRTYAPYGHMYLTCIAHHDQSRGNYYRNFTHPGDNGGVNETLKPQVDSLTTLESLARADKDQTEEWRERLGTFIQQYAAHLLLNYRSLHHDGISDTWKTRVKGAKKPGEVLQNQEAWAKVIARQQLLDEELLTLCTMGAQEEATLEALTAEGFALAAEITSQTTPQPLALDSVPLTESERELILQFRSRKEQLALTERMDGEVLVEKLAVSAKASTLDSDESYPNLIAIAGENRVLAQGGLGSIVHSSEKAEQAETMKSLRADNLYLRQKSEEIGSRSTHA